MVERRRAHRRGARLGDLHARRSPGRRRPADGLLDRARRTTERLGRPRPRPRSRASPIAPISSSATPRSPAETSPTSTSTSRSRYWKLACIVEGVYARYVAGAMGDPTARVRDVQAPGRTLRGHGGRDRGSRVVSPAEPAALYEIHEPAGPRRAGPRRRTRRVDRRAASARQLPASARRGSRRPDSDRDVRQRPAARLPSSPADDAPPRRGEHRARPGRASSCTTRRTTAARIVLLLGHEPDALWRQFTEQAVALAVDFGVRLVVGLGAYPFAAPHTRPSRLSTTANSSDLAERLGYLRNSVDVPAGVEAAIERRCAEAGLPAVGLWAQVPHYAAAMPYPAASIALIDGLSEVGGLSLEADGLRAGRRGARHPSRRARLPERRAPRDAAPARAAGRRGDRRVVVRRRSTRATCRPATTSPPSSSASCAIRVSRGRPSAHWTTAYGG